MNVSPRSVASARTVLDKGTPELVAEVDGGDAPVSTAANVARRPQDEQREALRKVAESPDGRGALRDVAKEVRAEEKTQRHAERQANAEKMAERNPGLPTGRTFPFVLIDVPRHHNVYADETGSEKAPENHYPTMTFDELVDFPIDQFAASDTIIAYWSTADSILDDLEILAEWGFVAFRPRAFADGKLIRGPGGKPLPPRGKGRYGSHQIWRKVRVGEQTGMGSWFRDDHEILLIARRGDVPAPLPGTQPRSVLKADVTDHSTKPGEKVRKWIDRCWPEMAKIEVFARGEAPSGWTFWRHQAEPAPAEETVKFDPETGEVLAHNPGPSSRGASPDSERDDAVVKCRTAEGPAPEVGVEVGSGADEGRAGEGNLTPAGSVLLGQCMAIPDFLRRTE